MELNPLCVRFQGNIASCNRHSKLIPKV